MFRIEQTPVTNLISPTWFRDISKSSIWIAGYRMMGVTQKDFTNTHYLDLGDVRAILSYGLLSYMDASDVFEFGTDHVRTTNTAKFVSKKTNIGGWTILITPCMVDGVKREEVDIRSSLAVAEGILSAFNCSNMVYERVYENVVELSPFKVSAFAPIFRYLNRSPNLQASALGLLSQLERNLQALPEDKQNRVKLSLRWYSKSLTEMGLDGFLSIWIALEVIGMPNTSDVRPAVQALARIYQMDYQAAKDRFQLGRIHGFRSNIVHDGKMFPIHAFLITYLEAVYVDLLAEILNLPHSRRAETVFNDPQFDLGKYIFQSQN